MKTAYPIIVKRECDRVHLSSLAQWSAAPFRLLGWLLGVIVGSFVAGIMVAWEDVR